MSTLVFLEHHGSGIQKGSLGVLSKAAALDPSVAAVLIGSGVAGLAAEAAKYGAATVYVADDASLAAPLPQPRVDVIAGLVRDKGIGTVADLSGAPYFDRPSQGGQSVKGVSA